MNDLALDALATYRLTRLVVADEITSEPRLKVIAWTLEYDHPKLRYLATCVHCLSPYLYAAVAVGKHLPGGRRVRDSFAVLGIVSIAQDLLHP